MMMMLVAGRYAVDSDDDLLGQGAYGSVYRARDNNAEDKVVVAVKKMKDGGGETAITQSGLRELTVLKNMQHANIVTLIDVFATEFNLYLIMELMSLNLHQYLKSKPSNQIAEHELKEKTKQLLGALAYCHGRKFVHRDIKPCNILVSSDGRLIKLTDFGCAKFVGFPDISSTSQVCTLWYRAPEVFLGFKQQFGHVDVWSTGCVMAEMITGRVLFATYEDSSSLVSDLKQFELVVETLGFPDDDTWPNVTQMDRYFEFRYLRGLKIQLEKSVHKQTVLQKMVPDLSAEGVELLSQLLTVSPVRRTTAKEALESDYLI